MAVSSGAAYGKLGALIAAARTQGRLAQAGSRDEGWASNEVERLHQELIDMLAELFAAARSRGANTTED